MAGSISAEPDWIITDNLFVFNEKDRGSERGDERIWEF
jgi:hypothetical protein